MFADNLYNTITTIKNTASTNQKLEILKDYITGLDEWELAQFKTFSSMVYSYKYVYGIKKIPKVEHTNPTDFCDLHWVMGAFLQFNDRKLTGNNAIAMLTKILESSASKSIVELAKMLVNRTFDCGMSITSVNKAFGYKLIPEHLVMKQEAATDKLLDKFTYPAYSQMKMDAIRIEIGLSDNKVIMYTSGGLPITTGNDELDKIMLGALDIYRRHKNIDKIYLDGEMIFLDKEGKHLPRKISNGIANRCIHGSKEVIEVHEIQFAVWDILTEEEKAGTVKTPYKEKFELLQEIVAELNTTVYAIPETIIINNKQEAIDIAIRYVKAGLEGSIVKDFTGHYQQKRVKYQLKLKAARQIEMRVVGYNYSVDNKYDGLIGSIQCMTDDKKLAVDVSGLTDDERKEYIDNPIIGKVVTIEFNEIITKENEVIKSLFLPRIIEVRIDKDETDTLESAMIAPFVVV